VIKGVAMELAPPALKRNIDLAQEGIGHALMIEGNTPMLREMFSNLIDNAIRYGPTATVWTRPVAAV
jgi:two-component system sensor histidine kinase TctE